MGLIRNIRKGFMFLGSRYDLAPEDASLLARYLTDPERALFVRMDPPDQEHSLRVTRKVQEALQHYPQLDERVLTKAALLHDVGKVGGRLGLLFRTFWVTAHKTTPELLDRLAWRGEHARRGSLRHKMYVQVAHASLGADLLGETGTQAEVRELVRCTGDYCEPDDPLPKWLLLSADADRVLTPQNEAKWRDETEPSRKHERGR